MKRAKLPKLLPLFERRRAEQPVPSTWNYRLDGTWRLGEKPFYGEGGTTIEDSEVKETLSAL